MNLSKPNTAILITALLIAPFSVAYLSHSFFESSSKEVNSKLSQDIGKVAGISDVSVRNITDEIPIMPGSEITSIDSSNNDIFVTLESPKQEEEIKAYYEDYFFTNQWEEISKNIYQKEGKKLSINISENIIKINLEN